MNTTEIMNQRIEDLLEAVKPKGYTLQINQATDTLLLVADSGDGAYEMAWKMGGEWFTNLPIRESDPETVRKVRKLVTIVLEAPVK